VQIARPPTQADLNAPRRVSLGFPPGRSTALSAASEAKSAPMHLRPFRGPRRPFLSRWVGRGRTAGCPPPLPPPVSVLRSSGLTTC